MVALLMISKKVFCHFYYLNFESLIFFVLGFNNALDGLSGIACVASHKSEFDQCYSQIRGAYSDMQDKDKEKVS